MRFHFNFSIKLTKLSLKKYNCTLWKGKKDLYCACEGKFIQACIERHLIIFIKRYKNDQTYWTNNSTSGKWS